MKQLKAIAVAVALVAAIPTVAFAASMAMGCCDEACACCDEKAAAAPAPQG